MILRYPTHIEIENYTEGTKKTLENSLSVYDQVTHSYTFSAFLFDEDNKKILIPGGYPIEKLKKWFPAIDIKDYRTKVNDFKKVEKYFLVCKPRNDIQNKAIDFLIGQKDLIYPQKYLALQTGQGKTYCVINYLFKTRKLPLIIVDQENLANQWRDSITQFTSLKEDEIFMIKGKKSIEKIMSMNEKELDKYKYFIGIHRTFSMMFEENPESITKFFEHTGIGCKVFDEAHIEYYNIFYMDCVTNCETIYLSATPERSNPNEKKVYNNMFYHVPIYAEDIKEKYLNIIMYQVDTNCPLKYLMKFKKVRGFDVISYSKYAIETEAFTDSLYDLLPKIFNNDFKQNKKIAIIFKMLDHIDLAKEVLEEFFKDKDHNLTIGVLTGNTKSKDKEKVLSNNIILSTDSSFSKGLDVENLSVIINYVPIGTLPKLNQITGRLRKLKNEKTFFIDVCDISVDDIAKQVKKIRLPYYKKTAKQIFIMKGWNTNGK